jgi:hypothetical protein
VQVHESQIEDILATYPQIARKVLHQSDDVRLVVRQMPLPSGRLDMLFACGKVMLLVELKVEQAIPDHVWQVRRYQQDLQEMQTSGSLVAAPIVPILVAPMFSSTALHQCEQEGVISIQYSIKDVLTDFLGQITAVTSYLEIRPKDYGLWNRGLSHRVLYALDVEGEPVALVPITGLSRRSIMNHLRFLVDLHLATEADHRFGLTDIGRRYVDARNPDMPPSEVSDGQLAILRDHIARNPFGSPIFFGISAIVEAIFALSRNLYPVPDGLGTRFYQEQVGKIHDWREPRSAYQGYRMYSNYAVELGLLARVGRSAYITPDGLKFILLLNLHKSIQMVDAAGLSRTGGNSP